MVSTSWAVTLTPLIIFLIGIGLEAIGVEMPANITESLNNLVYFFIASATAGASVSIARTIKN